MYNNRQNFVDLEKNFNGGVYYGNKIFRQPFQDHIRTGT